jgi:hypothetical protein
MVPRIEQVLEYKTSSMQFPQYAECWSLVAYLANSEKEFSKLVDDLRDGMSAADALKKDYNLTMDELFANWRTWVMS